MSKAAIERVPLNAADDLLIGDAGVALHRAVHDSLTRGTLRDLYLPGVIKRHSDLSESVKTLQRAQLKMDQGKMAASLLMYGGRCVGMDSRQPDLGLRQPNNQLFGLAPAWLRKVPGLSSLLASEVPMPGPNVSAWLAAEFMTIDNLTPVYEELVREGGEGSWTLASKDRSPVNAEAVKAAGMRDMGQARYDEFESGGIAPLRTLYAYMPSTGVPGAE